MNTLYEKAEQFMVESFAAKPQNIKHLERTAYWAQQFRPDIDEAFLIAAVTHDIERAARASVEEPKDFRDPEFLRLHQEKGAQIMGKFLQSEEVDPQIINRVQELIRCHEVGGTEDQSFLKDMDSLSFFENNAGYFVTQKALLVGKQAVKEKLEWMFERIDDEAVIKLAQPYYEDAIKALAK